MQFEGKENERRATGVVQQASCSLDHAPPHPVYPGVEYIPVTMIREDLNNLPNYSLPPPFSMRDFTPGDEDVWAAIEFAATEFKSMEKAREHFDLEFGDYQDELCNRCRFLVAGNGRAIGTATAWRNPSYRGNLYGRLHWVAIHPDFQGRGLSKPLVGAAMQRLREFHNRAYLTSQTTSWKAIKVYLDFGFSPVVEADRHRRAWELLWQKLRHPGLSSFASEESWKN